MLFVWPPWKHCSDLTKHTEVRSQCQCYTLFNLCKSCSCWSTSRSSAVTALCWSEDSRQWKTSWHCQLELHCVGNNLTLHYSVLHGCSIGKGWRTDRIKSAGWAIWCSLASPVFFLQQLTRLASSLGSGKTAFYCSDKVSYNYWIKERKREREREKKRIKEKEREEGREERRKGGREEGRKEERKKGRREGKGF